MIAPCSSCPWRRSTKSADIPGGGVDGKAVAEAALSESIFARPMGCHLHPERPATPCIGFVLACGEAASLRIPIALNLVKPDAYACDEELHTLQSLIRAHGCKC